MPLEHPYTDLSGGQWLRGNLHTHTTRSDGKSDPQVVIDEYARRGYDFLMFSDHDIHTSPQDYAQWDSRGMVLIPGSEVSANGPHLLYVNAPGYIDPLPQRQAILNCAARAGSRGFFVVNHPDWKEHYDHCTLGQLREWVGYAGIEIYNGVISRLDGSPYALNKWDMLLAGGRRAWGFANDDAHRLECSDVELGWNVAYVKERSADGVADALASGRFYASTGVNITNIAVSGTTIRIETDIAQRICAIMQTGRRFETANDRVIEVTVPEKARYVRFECWGPAERFAWTQPFFVV